MTPTSPTNLMCQGYQMDLLLLEEGVSQHGAVEMLFCKVCCHCQCVQYRWMPMDSGDCGIKVCLKCLVALH